MADHTEITPFRIDVPQADLDDLTRRLAETRWPAEPAEDPANWRRGIPPAVLRPLAESWRSFDWRSAEARLNRFPQFTTEIDGQRMHFLHVRSAEPDAIPLLLLHGYPGSVVEFEKIIDPLTDPGPGRPAFHVIAPSLPGFAFSTPLSRPGWELGRTSRAVAELMRRLGYRRYAAQGGDIGAGLCGALGAVDPEHLIGVHVNSDPLAVGYITSLTSGGRLGDPDGELGEADRAELARIRDWLADGTGYLGIQTTRPQTIGYGLADSPVLQLAWIAEKFQEWTDPARDLMQGAVDLDQLLTLVSVYWFTRTGPSAARFLWESAHAGEWLSSDPGIPQGWAMFGGGTLARRLADPKREIGHWSQFGHGGHFAAMETPDDLVADIRTFFAALR
jgi:pimeloyl-ACP methyl ester carboxylesterase